MSNDIELNPGPHFQNSFFSFMNKFERVSSIGKSSLNYSVDIADPFKPSWKRVTCWGVLKESHGGVC